MPGEIQSSATLDAADEWLTARMPRGEFGFSFSGSFTGALSLQCEPPGGAWTDVVDDLAGVGIEGVGIEYSPTEMRWRIGFKSGVTPGAAAVVSFYRGAD